MKPKQLLSTACFVAALLTSSSLMAQVKVGTNPTTINPNNNLEVEATGGNKVSVNKSGKLTIADGTQGASKVLTSDANGVASWQVNKVNCGSFDAVRSTAQAVPIRNSIYDPGVVLISTTEFYDPSDAYNPSTGEYTIPATGMYMFKASAVDSYPNLVARRNSTLSIVSAARGALSTSVTADQIYTDGSWNDVVAIAYLTAGDKITAVCQITHKSGTKPAETLDVVNIKFSGSRVDCTGN